MFGVLRFSATAPLSEVVRAIQRTPAHCIALVFPLGEHVHVAEIGRMGVIDLLCREQRKEGTIIGGDAQLRASAIACGLRAAMTVEDWRAMGAARYTWLTRRKTRPSGPVQLTLLPAPPADDRCDAGEAHAYHDEPDEIPEFIRELLALHGHDPLPSAQVSPYHDVPATPQKSIIAYDLDRDDGLRALWESDEERLTEAIRRSSGLDTAALAAGWSALAKQPSRTVR